MECARKLCQARKAARDLGTGAVLTQQALFSPLLPLADDHNPSRSQ